MCAPADARLWQKGGKFLFPAFLPQFLLSAAGIAYFLSTGRHAVFKNGYLLSDFLNVLKTFLISNKFWIKSLPEQAGAVPQNGR